MPSKHNLVARISYDASSKPKSSIADIHQRAEPRLGPRETDRPTRSLRTQNLLHAPSKRKTPENPNLSSTLAQPMYSQLLSSQLLLLQALPNHSKHEQRKILQITFALVGYTVLNLLISSYCLHEERFLLIEMSVY